MIGSNALTATVSTIILGVLLMTGNDSKAADSRVAIAVHGGSGAIRREDLDPGKEAEIRAVLKRAVSSGHEILTQGGSSLEAVMAAVVVLEDSPHFNAGRGAVYNSLGEHELDASIMEGKERQAGAVAAVKGVRNPVLLAHKVMTDSPHVMLMGDGAEEFAREKGITFESEDYFHTEFRREQWERVRERNPSAHAVSESPHEWLSTVGAVALDSDGNLAAATSTGGTTNKRWGRVGDSPIVGAGTFADNRSCAVSATGEGEYFIRAAVAKDICARVQYQGIGLADAVSALIHGELVDMGGEGGVIAIDPEGTVVMDFNTDGMYRASIDSDGTVSIGIYRDD